MKFSYPEFLFAFLVLLIPIIIHLFNFRKYKTLYFSSLQFLKSVEEQTKSTQKIKHILVLIARVLAFSCLVLAFAQPYLPKNQNAVNTKNPVLAIYLDNSFSMEAIGTNGELLSEGRETVRKILEDASLESSFLFFTNALSGIEQRITSKNEVLNRLDEIEVSPVQKNIETVLSLQKEVLDKENWEGPRQYITISDFQKVTSEIKEVAIDTTASYYPIQLTPQNTANLYIDSVWFSSPLRKVNNNNELNVRIKNNGRQDLENVQLSLDIANNNRTILIDINANDFAETVLNYTDQTTGEKAGSLEINDEQLYFDDKFFFSYQVQSEIKVLLLNGKNAPENPEYVFETDSYYNLTSINENQLTLDQVVNKDLVILNGLNTVSSGQKELLLDFVNNGGSLFIIPGNQISLSDYNQLLTALEMPSFGKTITSGLNVNTLNYQDYFFNGIFQSKPEKLNLPYVKKAYSLIENTRYSATKLLSYQNKQALFLKSNDAKKVYLLSTALQEEFSKITSHALFAAILLRAGELSQRSNKLYATLGETDDYRILNFNNTEGAIHLKNSQVDFIPPTEQKGNFSFLQLNTGDAITNLKQGIYSISKEKELAKIALNYNRKESDVSTFKVAKIEQDLKQAGAKNVTSSSISNLSEIATLDIEKPTEYWRILLIFALVFFLIEMLLLKFLKA